MASTAETGSGGRPPAGDPGNARHGLTPVSLFLVLLLFWIMTRIQIVLVLGLLALLFGTILEGPVSRLERRHVPRPAAIAMIYVVVIGALVLGVIAIVPIVADQTDTFQREVPARIRDLEQDWRASSNPLLSGAGADGLQRALDFIDEPSNDVPDDVARRVLPVVVSIGTGIVSTISLLVIVFYYLMEKALIRRVVLAQLPERSRGRVDRVWTDVERKVGGWMRGQLLLCLIIGTIATIGYAIIGLPFWPLLGLWAGMTEILPIVGPWIGGVPAVILALTVGWDKAIATAAIIVAMQTLENWFLVPRVMRGAVGLTPLTVFIAILAGQQFLGIVGAVLAIPVAAAIQVIISDWLAARRRAGTPEESLISGWRWLLARAMREDIPSSPMPPTPMDGRQQRERDTDAMPSPATSGQTGPSSAESDRGWNWHKTSQGLPPKPCGDDENEHLSIKQRDVDHLA